MLKNLKGEHGDVTMVLVCESARCEKYKITDSVFHCLVRARNVFIESKRLAVTKQCSANVQVLWPCGNLSGVII